MEFEWDEAKAEANLRKHGLHFRDADLAFDGRPKVLWTVDRGGETRHCITVLVDGHYFTVVWTRRGHVIRLISMRRASDHERRTYRSIYGG